MVRPLPSGANWTAGLLQQHRVVPGVSIDVTPTGQHHQNALPHRTEDLPVDRATIQHVNSGPINWFAAGAPLTHATVSDAFSGHIAHNSIWNNVRQGVYVKVGTQTGSLAAVRLGRNAVQFLEEFNKLRAKLNDGGTNYKLPVSSLALKSAWQQGGLVAVQQALPTTQQFHVRLGLARAFGNPPEKCYLMVNGIHG
ncbi:MAG: hypothetical protein KDA59_25175 [Planctomycetales bacterium]|nr:hypothetical protein [Planctomycetales bacterium]